MTHIGEFKEAILLAEEIQSKILVEQINPSVRKIFLANLCQNYLCDGQIKKALHSYNSIYKDSKYKEIRNDIDPGMNILGLAIFYELKLVDNIESLLRSALRNGNFNSQCKAYKKVLTFFKKLIQTNNSKEITGLFIAIEKELGSIDFEDQESIFFLENTLIKTWISNYVLRL